MAKKPKEPTFQYNDRVVLSPHGRQIAQKYSDDIAARALYGFVRHKHNDRSVMVAWVWRDMDGQLQTARERLQYYFDELQHALGPSLLEDDDGRTTAVS